MFRLCFFSSVLVGLSLLSSPAAGYWGRLFASRPRQPNPYESYEAGFQAGQMQRMGAPTYNWGYFGVRSRPNGVCHKGYYGDYIDVSYRSGY